MARIRNNASPRSLPARCAAMAVISLAAITGGCALTPVPAPAPPAAAPRIALALGGGAARGFAHVGVIKALEAAGVRPQIVSGTSAGSLVAALYAGGYSGLELQRLALEMDERTISDWSLPDRGVIRGEALQNYVNAALAQRPMERLPRTLAIVATDLQSGDPVVFRTGDAGMAVRASSGVPGLFQPVRIGGREYVDGGLTSPVPVNAARELGADIVIAVDISSAPRQAPTASLLDVLMQTFNIMGHTIAAHELQLADIVVRPALAGIAGGDFQSRHLAILEGERAATAALPALRERIESQRRARR